MTIVCLIQYNIIQELSEKVKKSDEIIEKLEGDKAALIYSNKAHEDSLQLMQSQLDNARRAYEKDILLIQPVVENRIVETYKGSRDVTSLRNEMGIRYARVTYTEMKVDEARNEIIDLRQQREDLLQVRVSSIFLFINES